jgi:bifunctional non-homologous end joining protein LigD
LAPSLDEPTTLDWPVTLPAVRRGDTWHARSGDIELRLSNLHKVYWPETGYTKGDLLSYYFNVATTLLPHVENRPLTLRRMPEGVAGPYFYEKDAPRYTPSWMPVLPAQGEERVIRFVTITDVASLLWVANLGCIELHPHHTRGDVQDFPTYAVFDLDPFAPAGVDEAKQVARLVKVTLDQLGLRSYPKTSGMTGLQVYVPLDGGHSYEQVRAFVTEVCLLINKADPSLTTVEWEVGRRAGRVFLDSKMNRAGASLAAPYSVRAEWAAPVSMPFEWDEFDAVDLAHYTIATTLDRIADAGDPFEDVAGEGQRLTTPMKALGLDG